MSEPEIRENYLTIAADLHASMVSLTESTQRALDTARMQDETIRLLEARALAAESALTQAQAENERLRGLLDDWRLIYVKNQALLAHIDDDYDLADSLDAVRDMGEQVDRFYERVCAALASVPDTTEEDA